MSKVGKEKGDASFSEIRDRIDWSIFITSSPFCNFATSEMTHYVMKYNFTIQTFIMRLGIHKTDFQ